MSVRRCLIVSAAAAVATGCFFPGGGGSGPPSCSGAITDACRKGENLATMVGIQFLDAVAGGNAILGAADTRGFGKVGFDIRANVAQRNMPKLGGVTFATDGSVPNTTFQTDNASTTTLTADLALGVWRGFRVGSTHVFGLALLGSLSMMRDYEGTGLHVTANGQTAQAFGFRVGLTEETRLIPGVSFSQFTRSLPRLTITSDALGSLSGESVRISSTLKANDEAWRLVASKTIRKVGLSLGIGGEVYLFDSDNSVTLFAKTNLNAHTEEGNNIRRMNIFVDASTDLGVVKLVGEVGLLTGGDEATRTSVRTSRALNAPRSYFALGLRVGY